MTRLVLVAGTTRTAEIPGISAAGADPEVMVHTPSADAEILERGRTVAAPLVPVSPSGTPTPAVVTRAVREQLDVPVTVIDGGLAEPAAVGTVAVGAEPGGDIREREPVPTAPGAFAAAREFGRETADREVFVGETIPGGTTTALGVLTALGDPASVSSSLPDNPIETKRAVVAAGLAASGLERGGAAGQPERAVRTMGDPVLATAAGFALGAHESGTAVTLAGGTQMLAVASLLRHAGVEGTLSLATTSYVAADPTADVDGLARALDVDVTATDPGFEALDHPAGAGYLAGEAKEGVAMGGALALTDRNDVPMATVRERVAELTDRLVGATPGAGV